MFFLRRRRVFIGECDGQAVYYDQKTREALAAPKSFLLNTEGARKTNAYIPEMVIFFHGRWARFFWILFSYVHWCL